jgi:zinc protease
MAGHPPGSAAAAAGCQHLASHRFGPDLLVERFQLGNGLGLLVLVDPRAPVACYQTWFDVGSRHERPGKTGIAHLFEHLMFGETESLPHGELDRLLEEAGAEGNAATYLDWTYYVAQLPREALELVVRLESERMHRLVLGDEQVAREREVVSNERRQTVDDDVDSSVGELLYAEAFREHGYRWPTIGTMEDILGLSTDDCREFYRAHYAPNRARIVVVGDVELPALVAMVAGAYGGIPPVEDVHPEPPQVRERRMVTRKPTAANKLVVGYHGPAYGDFDHPALVLLNEVLFGGRASRAHRRLVQRLEIASNARGYVGTFRDPGLYDLWLTARGDVAPATLLGELDGLLGDACREPVSEQELERAKARVELGSLQGLDTVSGKASQIGFSETVLGEPVALFSKLEAYRRASRSDLLRAARRYLRPNARTVIEVLSDAEPRSEGG